ncbi:alaserpin-like [Zophobas morio]|uniref:alaserpin-like n=1 Tax=Zophobas morio TaxID=2755281 RepID=UPI00308293B2
MKLFLVLSLCATAAFASEADLQKFATSSKLFTGAVYKELLVDNNDNILVSPFSAETVLALTQSGAIGLTGEEIRSSLFLPDTKEETEAIIKSVLPTIQSDQYTLKTANKIYVEDNLAIKQDFQKVATDVYQAGFQSIEFAESVEAAEEINQWVEEQTNDKIHDLVSPDALNENTRVVLVNALYFQANWSIPFIPDLTTKATFYAPNDEEVESDFMFIKSEALNFYESEELDAKFLQLPFLGESASMTFVVPNKKEGIAVLEKQSADVLNVPEYKQEVLQVSLPKFKIEATVDFENILENLGVHAAFNPEVVDFSGIAGKPGDIVISKVTQKTFIDVNEVGVEAASATGIVVPINPAPPALQIFTVDRPFMFYITVNDVVLFEGRVLVPNY